MANEHQTERSDETHQEASQVLSQCIAAAAITSVTNPTAITAVQPTALSKNDGPFVSHKAASTKPRMMRKAKIIYFTARHSPQLYTTGLLGSEWLADSAMDVTMIAAPMAFCRGVSDAQPAVRQRRETSNVFIESSVIRGNGIIAQVENAH